MVRLAYEQMEVFGHDYVSGHYESVALTDCFQNLQKQISSGWRAQQRPAIVAAAGDEVQVAVSVEAVSPVGMEKACLWAAAVFKSKCLALMDEVKARRVTILITKRGRPVAKLEPADNAVDDIFGFFQGKGSITGDVLSPVLSAGRDGGS